MTEAHAVNVETRASVAAAWRIESYKVEAAGDELRVTLSHVTQEIVNHAGEVVFSQGEQMEVVITRRQAREFLRFIDPRI